MPSRQKDIKKTEPDDFKKSLVKNTFFQFLFGVFGKIGGLIFTVIVARSLYPELFGVYSLALTIILTIIMLSDLGMSGAITRYVAESLDKKGKESAKKKETRSKFLFLFKFKFFSSLILAVLLFVLAGVIAAIFKKPDLILPLRIGSIYLIFMSIYGVVPALFLALKKVKYSAIVEGIFEASRVLLIILFMYLYKTVSAIFIALSIALLITLIVAFFFLKKNYSFLFKGKKQPVERKRLLFFSGFLTINSLNAVIFTNADKLVLGYFSRVEFVGFYTAIFTIISGVIALINFSNVVLPFFVSLKGKKILLAFRKFFSFLSMILFPATIGLAFIFIPLLKILYGASYVPLEYQTVLSTTSILLSFLILEGIFTSFYTNLFNAKEKPKWPALLMFFAAILNIALNIIFVYFLIRIRPEYGLIGVAVATIITRYLNLFLLAIICKKKFNLAPSLSSIIKPLLGGILMLLLLSLLSFFIGKIGIQASIPILIIEIIFGSLVYLVFMLIIKGITKKDFNLIKSIK